MRIVGSGFQPGARVTLGGVEAWVWRVTATKIEFVVAWQAPGLVDVVVTNPDGLSATLSNGFTIKAATLVLSKSDVVAGETLAVTWRGPNDPSDFAPCDRIGVYRVGDSSNAPFWYTCSGIGDEFSEQFTAPSVPGDYEVRYHMEGQYLLTKIPLTVR